MTAWDDLLTSSRPGLELPIGADRWLVLSRRYDRSTPDLLTVPDDRITFVVELVRVGSGADPRPPGKQGTK